MNVTVGEASGLRPTQLDLHVSIFVGGVEQRTLSVPSSSPIWNETLQFDLGSTAELLSVKVMDANQEIIGLASLQLPETMLTRDVEDWFNLETDASMPWVTGQIKLKLAPEGMSQHARMTSAARSISSSARQISSPFFQSLEPALIETTIDDTEGLCGCEPSLFQAVVKQIRPVYRFRPEGIYDQPRPTYPLYSPPGRYEAPVYHHIVRPAPIVVRLTDLVAEVKAVLPQLTDDVIVSALKGKRYNVADSIDALLKDLITEAGKTEEAQQLFSTAIMDFFGPTTADQTITISSPQNAIFIPGKNGTPGKWKIESQTSPSIGGRRKALLIGVNYPRTKETLKGCVADAFRVRTLLTGVYGFHDTPHTMRVLVDEDVEEGEGRHFQLPTYKHIIEGIRWLVQDCQAGDCLVFHFSGHGSQQLSSTPEFESDFLDETILPCDWRKIGHMTDDTLNQELVQQVPEGAKLTAILDCCHSGTGFDLPFILNAHGREWDRVNAPRPCKGDVQLLSGCRSDQTSADVQSSAVGAGGAMTFALVTALATKPFRYKYISFLKRIEKVLALKGFQQRPQLSSSHAFDLGHNFSFTSIVPPKGVVYESRGEVESKRMSLLDTSLPGFSHTFVKATTPAPC